jgi:undecaprenyl-diphosphatase
MSIFQALLLGIIQGLTEYIPVSSTANLILIPWLLGWEFDPATTEVFVILVQWGTLVGVLVYFWRDIWHIVGAVLRGLAQRKPFATFEARLGWLVALATVPAVIAGVFIKGYLEQLYQMYLLISIVLMLGGVLMLIAERFGRRTRDLKQLTWLDALIVGVWQIFAMIPGFSRSSVTISGGMLRHFTRAEAARFSFLMSIPALLGAGVVALKDLFDTPGLLASLAAPLVVGFLAAALTGYLSIRWLLGYLKTRSLNIFVVYRFVFGGFCLIVGLIRLAGQ